MTRVRLFSKYTDFSFPQNQCCERPYCACIKEDPPKHTANICIGSTAEEHFFRVIFEKITRIYLLSQVHEKSAINTHFKCNLIAEYLCRFYTRRNVISTHG